MLSIEQIAFLACELMHFSLNFRPFFASFLSFFSLWSLNKNSSLQNVLLNKWVVILYLSFHRFLSPWACCWSETAIVKGKQGATLRTVIRIWNSTQKCLDARDIKLISDKTCEYLTIAGEPQWVCLFFVFFLDILQHKLLILHTALHVICKSFSCAFWKSRRLGTLVSLWSR